MVAGGAIGAARSCPYQGLVPYAEADADWFFGRDEWCGVIGDNLRAYRITVLYGASGCGKSSVLRAGLDRRLRDEAHGNVAALGVPRLLPVVFADWSLDDPQSALRAAVAACARELAPELADGEGAGSLVETLGSWSARIQGPLLLVLDQLEELFRYHEQSQGTVLAELGALLRSRDPAIHFLLSIREDAIAQLDGFEGYVPGLLDHLLRLGQLDRAAARKAIVEPVLRWNATVAAPGESVELEPGLVDAILDQVTAGKVSLGNVGEGAARDGAADGIEAPYLQLVLTRLWDEEQHRWSAQGSGSRRLRLETLERLGGAERIVRTHLDTALAALPARERDLAGRTLRYLVTPSGTKIALRIADLADYAHVPKERLEPLVEVLAGDVRILRGAGDGRYEIYHDALAGPIVDWRIRWEERQRRRRERRRFMVLGGVAALLAVIALAIAVLAIQARHAQHSARIGQSDALAAQAVATLDTDPTAALQTALQAAGVSPTHEAEGALRSALANDPIRATLHGDVGKSTQAPVFSPDGKLIVTFGADAKARVWETGHGRLVYTLGKRGRRVSHAVFSPDGKLLVTTRENNYPPARHPQIVQVRRSATGAPLYTLRTNGSVFAFSPNGKLIVATTNEGRTQVWDSASGRLRRNLTGSFVEFTSDGKRVVTARVGHLVWIWDSSTGRLLHTLAGHRLAGDLVAFSPHGRLILTANEARAGIWDATRGRLRNKLKTGLYSIDAAAFSVRGDVVVLTGVGGAEVWDLASGDRLYKLYSQSGAAASPDGRLIVTISNDYNSGTAQVWGSARGALLHTLRGDNRAVASAVFSPDGRLIVTTGFNGTARIWDSGSGRLLQTLTGHIGQVLNAEFSQVGSLIATSGTEGTVRIWDSPTTTDPYSLTGSKCATSAGFSPGGGRIFTTSSLTAGFCDAKQSATRVWDSANGRLLGTLTVHAGCDDQGVFSPDGKLIASIVTSDHYCEKTRAAHVWDVGSGRPLYTLPGGFIAFSPRGDLVVTLGDGKSAWVWNAADGRLRHTLTGQPGDFDGGNATFSPDGKLIVTSGVSNARVWDASTGHLLHTFSGNLASNPVFSPDGKMIITAGNGEARVWDTSSGGRLLHTLTDTGLVTSTSFSPDGKLIVTGANGTAHVWDSASGHLLHTLAGHTARITSVVFSPDGKLFMTIGDSTPRVWDTASGRLRHALTGHNRRVYAAAFSPNGKLIVTASGDRTARVWDSTSGASLETITGHTSRVTNAAFSPNGRLLITTDDAGEARVSRTCDVCNLGLDQLVARASERVRATR